MDALGAPGKTDVAIFLFGYVALQDSLRIFGAVRGRELLHPFTLVSPQTSPQERACRRRPQMHPNWWHNSRSSQATFEKAAECGNAAFESCVDPPLTASRMLFAYHPSSRPFVVAISSKTIGHCNASRFVLDASDADSAVVETSLLETANQRVAPRKVGGGEDPKVPISSNFE